MFEVRSTVLAFIFTFAVAPLAIAEDSYFNARLLSPTEMELCLAETKKTPWGCGVCS